MPKRRHRSAEDEARYWKTRTILEFARVALEIAWDVLRRGGGVPL
jgi:hypothetical protein